MCDWILIIEDYENVGNNLYYTSCNHETLANHMNEDYCPYCYKRIHYKGVNRDY